MKVVTQNGKPKYVPVTITLETPDEYFSVLSALGGSSINDEILRLKMMAVDFNEKAYKPCRDIVFFSC